MRRTIITLAVLCLVAMAVVYAAIGQGIQFGKGENPLEIQRLLHKFFEAQAKAPFRYPTACVAGTAEEYTQMALSTGRWDTGDGRLRLWTVPEEFSRVNHPEPDRKSGRCDYRVPLAGESKASHFIADFFSRKRPRTGEIAYVKVWQQGDQKAVLVTFPNGPRGVNPDIRFNLMPVDARVAGSP